MCKGIHVVCRLYHPIWGGNSPLSPNNRHFMSTKIFTLDESFQHRLICEPQRRHERTEICEPLESDSQFRSKRSHRPSSFHELFLRANYRQLKLTLLRKINQILMGCTGCLLIVAVVIFHDNGENGARLKFVMRIHSPIPSILYILTNLAAEKSFFRFYTCPCTF